MRNISKRKPNYTHTTWTRYADAYNYAVRLFNAWNKYSGYTFSVRRGSGLGRRWVVIAQQTRNGVDMQAPVRKNRRLSLPY